KVVEAIEDTSRGIVVQGLRGDCLPQKQLRVLLGEELFQAVQRTTATERIQHHGEHDRPGIHPHLRRHVVIDQADEAQLVGVGLENGQMVDRVHLDSGGYSLHSSLPRGTLATCFSLLTAIFPWLWPLRGQNTIRKNVFDHSLRGAECKFETKSQLGLKMIKRVKSHGLPFDLLACDALYG